MAEHNIEIEISKAGEVTAHIKGVKGKGCLAYGKILEEVVGTIKSQQLTSEYYETPTKASIHLEQKQET